MVFSHQTPEDAGTVKVRVQVIDLDPFALDMIVPTYIPASDLTQRVARDAGLGAYWEDGTRRNFYLRARGRVLRDEEKLEDLGIVPHELLHLLPEPPKGSQVEERAPEYPPNKGYAAAGNLNVVLGLMLILLWTVFWTMGLTIVQRVDVAFFPALGLGVICTNFARHLWGGAGNAIRIPVTGFVVFVLMMMFTMVVTLLVSEVGFLGMQQPIGFAAIGGVIGMFVSWLAWYGAVEPLPSITKKQEQAGEALVTFPCGVCGGMVTHDMRFDCPKGCGTVFHSGCFRAREAVSPESPCPVCGSMAG